MRMTRTSLLDWLTNGYTYNHIIQNGQKTCTRTCHIKTLLELWTNTHTHVTDEDDDASLDKDSVYEDLSEYSSGRGSMELRAGEETSPPTQDAKLSTLEMFGKKGTVLRALWSEMPEVGDFLLKFILVINWILNTVTCSQFVTPACF